jgi:hypothetical protein
MSGYKKLSSWMLPILLVINGASLAQNTIFQMEKNRLAIPSAGIQYWQVEDDAVHQIAIPLTFIVPVNEQLQLNLATSPAFSGYKSNGTVKLNGLSDTRLSGSYLFGEDRFMATFGVSLPTGKHALKTDELLVANILALHALNFDVPIFGQGLDVTAGMVTAQRWGDRVLGLGVGYLLRGAFEPIENATVKYNPGDEVNVTFDVDQPLGRKNKLMMDVNYTVYSSDTVEGTEVFKAGNRITLQGMLHVPNEGISWLFSVRDRIRAKNKVGSGDLIPERQNSNGNELELSAMGYLALNSNSTIRGLIEGRIYSNNAYDVGGATVVGFGGGYNRSLSARFQFLSDLRFYVGSMDLGTNYSIKGLRATVGLKVVL